MPTDDTIDAVYTWVNGDDETWQAEYLQRLITAGRPSQPTAVHRCRFRDYGELFYSLLSLHQFAPWVSRIFIIKKAYQSPDMTLLPQSTQNKIIWVDDATLKPNELTMDAFYPTFNSLALEANLHRIENLSETFLYFNNDMFLGRALSPQYFFQNGVARFSLKRQNRWIHGLKKIAQKSNLPFITGHQRHVLNSFELFRQEIVAPQQLGVPYASALLHQCCPLLKSSYQFLWEHGHIKTALLKSSAAPFRDDDQVHAVFLACLVGLWRKRARVVEEDDDVVQLEKKNFKKKLLRLTEERPHRFCVNDNPGNKNRAHTRTILTEFMQNYFYKGSVYNEGIRE